jgi:hypothetical protein
MKALRLFAALVLLTASLAAIDHAQTHPAVPMTPACDGVINIVRISNITANGSVEKFMAAVAAHQAWYASHGFSDVIVAARILQRDPQTHAVSYSDKQMMTFHYRKPNGPDPKEDSAWDAYVKMYQETSDVKETTLVCVPLAAAPKSLQ